MKTFIFSETFSFVSGFSAALGILCALIILIDVLRCPQKMKIMNTVWILNALWGSFLILILYFRSGRNSPAPAEQIPMDMQEHISADKPAFFSGAVAKATLHCGAGCSLADIIGSFLFYLFPFYLFSSLTAADWALSYVLALIIGISFQYAAIVPMKSTYPELKTNVSIWKRAFKVDFLSLTSWQIGMYCWMAIVIFALFGRISPLRFEYWFMMQIAMLAGFCTAYPVNYILIRKGIKKSM